MTSGNFESRSNELKKNNQFFILCLQKAGTPTFIVCVRDTIVANLNGNSHKFAKKTCYQQFTKQVNEHNKDEPGSKATRMNYFQAQLVFDVSLFEKKIATNFFCETLKFFCA